MKRLMMYLVPLMMMVMLFLSFPGELLAKDEDDLPYDDYLYLPWASASQDDDIPYFAWDSTSEPIDVTFDSNLRNGESNGTPRATITTDNSIHSWTADPYQEEDISFHEDSTQDSYYELEWDQTPSTGEAFLDLALTEYQE